MKHHFSQFYNDGITGTFTFCANLQTVTVTFYLMIWIVTKKSIWPELSKVYKISSQI
jgi:hypothetical protein